MPGVDFQVLRQQITMRAVLQQLQFEATGSVATSGVAPAQFMGRRIHGAVRFR